MLIRESQSENVFLEKNIFIDLYSNLFDIVTYPLPSPPSPPLPPLPPPPLPPQKLLLPVDDVVPSGLVNGAISDCRLKKAI